MTDTLLLDRPGLVRGDDVAGDSASPNAINRLSRALAKPLKAKDAKLQRKMLALLKRAVAEIRSQNYAAATGFAMEVLKLDERHGLAWHVLAISREKAGDLAPALTAYEAALKLLPNETDVAHDLGRLAQRLGYLEIAEKLLLKYLAARPGDLDATNNLACVMRDAGRYGEAVELLRLRIAESPDKALLWNTLGTVLSDQGEMAQSLTFFDEALRLEPGFPKALYNRANARMALGDARQALDDIETALDGAADEQETATMNMARALTQLLVGDLAEGFETYEARFSRTQKDALAFVTPAPRWTPDADIRGRRLLVFGEQGLGDEVLFANVLADVQEALGPEGHLILAVETRLVPLFQRSFSKATVVRHMTLRRAGKLVRAADLPEEAAPADMYAPIASLFRRFRSEIGAFPATGAFLTPDPARVAHWRSELAALDDRPTVGVVWKSLKLDGSRRRYFSPFDLWRPVLATPSVRFVNLQYGDCEAELEAAREAGLDLWTPPGVNLKDDLDEIVALCCALDTVIGPMNATTNLAAASGANGWIILTPDAWPRFGTGALPCYPQARAFVIDGFGQWDGVMARLAQALGD
jgi:tetratricopeptide (TPR) repeat protein